MSTEDGPIPGVIYIDLDDPGSVDLLATALSGGASLTETFDDSACSCAHPDTSHSYDGCSVCDCPAAWDDL